MRGSSVNDIEKAALANGMTTMRADGLNRVKIGVTSIQEILRVIV